MKKRKQSRKNNKRKQFNNNKKSSVTIIKRALLFVFLLFICGIAVQTYVSLRLIVNKFSKPMQWDISSKIYSNQSAVYPGKYYKKKYILEYLNLLSYKKVNDYSNLTNACFYHQSIGNAVHVMFHDSQQTITFKFDNQDFIQEIIHKTKSTSKVLNQYELPKLVLSEFFGDQREKRTVLAFNEFPETLKRGIIAMEDRSFYSHHGVSIKGVLRAVVTNLTRKSYAQGGSTLTQQLMKNFFLSHEKTLWRKWKELVLALIVDGMYSKEKIFHMYLNEIYLGQVGSVSVHGFEEAAQLYFHKSVVGLSISEQALLVGLISSPGRYSPFNKIEQSLKRRDLVLKKLFDEKLINQKKWTAAKNEKIKLSNKRTKFNRSTSLMNSVKLELDQNFTDLDLMQKGYKIDTSIDPILQKKLTEHSLQVYQNIVKNNKLDSHAIQMAAVSIHPSSGAIKAVVSGQQNSDYNHVYSMKRPIGSTVKPLILAYLIDKYKNSSEQFVSNAQILNDKKITISYDNKEWQPKNYANRYYGKVSLRTVIEKSLNLGFLDLVRQYSFKDIYEMAELYGFKYYEKVPALALGAIESNPRHLAGIYSSFVNSGRSYIPPGLIKKVHFGSESIQSRQIKTKTFVSDKAAYQVLSLLKGALKNGTGKSSGAYKLKYNYAGKTGTSNDHRDAWFIGLSKNLVTVVWFGLENTKKVKLTGSNSALKVWLGYTKDLESYLRSDDFDIPFGVKIKKIDKDKACRWGLFKNKKNNYEEVFLDQYSIKRCAND